MDFIMHYSTASLFWLQELKNINTLRTEVHFSCIIFDHGHGVKTAQLLTAACTLVSWKWVIIELVVGREEVNGKERRNLLDGS